MQILFTTGTADLSALNQNGIVGLHTQAPSPPVRTVDRAVLVLFGQQNIYAQADECGVQGAIEATPYVFTMTGIEVGAEEGQVLLINSMPSVQGNLGGALSRASR